MVNKIKVGDKFNRLTVVEKTEERFHAKIVWLCECDCGNFKKVNTDYLRQGRTGSCGCLRTEANLKKLEKARKNNYRFHQDKKVTKFNTLVRNYRSNAKSRNLVFELNKEEIKDLCTKECHYCGKKPVNKILGKNHYTDYYNGIDRKDSKLGYTVDNVVSCCSICNVAKNKMEYNDYIDYLNNLVKWRNNNVND